MGMDFSYLLYFKREHLWKTLQAVVDMADSHHPPTRVLFPDNELLVPLRTWTDNNGQLNHDDPDLDFNMGLYFEEDEAIQYWRRNLGNDEAFRSPPDAEVKLVSIGCIYLTIHQAPSQWFPQGGMGDLVAFNFGTTGTRMSLLFDESPSIRKGFLGLLRRIPGVCGVFNREDSGEVFWMEGEEVYAQINDPFLPPDEIKTILNSRGNLEL